MTPRHSLPLLLLAGLVAACGDGGGPDLDDEAARIAARFDALADSIGTGGHEPTSEALRHAADLVRLTGGATPVTLTIDGEPRDFLAVAEQLDFPLVVCAWPADTGGGTGGSPPDGGCTEAGTQSMRTLIAWEPEEMAEVVRIVADTGATPAQEGVPDVMTGLPTYGGADSSVTGSPVGYPGFSGEYLVRDVGSWWARQGTQSNGLEAEGGACTDDRVTFGWAELGCRSASLRFEFSMEVAAATWEYRATGERLQSDAVGTHQIAMAGTVIEGVRLTVLGWTPPEPEPGPPPPPVDTVTTLQLDVSFDAVKDGAGVALRLRVTNPTAQAVTFDFASGQRYDFAASTPGGEVLWRWSADKAFTMAVGSVTLQPGASLEYEERWEPDGIVGEVVLEAALTSLNLPIVRSDSLAL
ncbi:MAG TPA: BsuPI-related putative proteinase inhibitor [Gemmatimonadales bacterium]|nr:BsuPI-related putative proteinase inhibitor [Gemmatimonadales bacterium]